jgi:hypothetical protein
MAVVGVEMGVDVVVVMWGVAMAMWRHLWVVMQLRWVNELPQFDPNVGNRQGARWQQWWSHAGGGGCTVVDKQSPLIKMESF